MSAKDIQEVPVAKHDTVSETAVVPIKPEVGQALKQTKDEVEVLRSEVDNLVNNDKVLKKEIASMRTDMATLKEEHDASQVAKDILDGQIRALNAKLAEQEKTSAAAKQEVEELRRKADEAIKSRGETAAKLTQAEAQVASTAEQLRQQSALASEASKLKEDIITLEQELREYKREDSNLKEQVNEENQQIIELQNQIAALQNSQAPITRAKDDEIKALNEKLVKAEEQVSLLKLIQPELETAKKRIITLETDIATFKDHTSQQEIAKDRIKELEAQASKSQLEATSQHEKLIAAELATREHGVQVDRLRAQLAQEQAAVKTHKDKIDSLLSAAPDQKVIEQLTKSKAAVQAELDAKANQLKARDSELSNLKSKAESEIADYKMKLSASAAELKSTIAQLKAQTQEHDSHIKKLNAQLQKQSTSVQGNAGDIGKLQTAKADLEQIRDRLTEENDKLKNKLENFEKNQVAPKAPYIAGLFGLGFGLFTLLRVKQLTA